jgi:uncharacterized protein (TIGR02599 family)
MTLRAPVAAPRAFTLIEMMAAMAVMAVILVVLMSMTDQVRRTLRQTTGKVEQFREAREGFEAMTRRLSQATLNTYWDYDNVMVPTRYVRQSELRFLSGPASDILGTPGSPGQAVFFQAPLGFAAGVAEAEGLENLLNTWGFFIEFGHDRDDRPAIITDAVAPPKYRFRLCEFMEPANEFRLYRHTSGAAPGGAPVNLAYTGREWFRTGLAKQPPVRPVRVLAKNIIALVVLPKLAAEEDPSESQLAPDYLYDSTTGRPDPATNPKNQLPPILQVTMVAIDEASAIKLENGPTAPALIPAGLFANAARFHDDLAALEQALAGRRITYRVFTSNVSIAGAKWSTDQAN